MNQEWKLSHLGMVVRDLDVAIADIEKTGLGICGEVMPMEQDGELVAKMCMAQIGQVQFELFQHISGNTMLSQFVDTHKEGLHHISYVVDDLDTILNRFNQNGIALLGKRDVENGNFIKKGKVAFIGTEHVLGTLLELEQIDQEY